MSRDAAAYADQLRALLPPGRAWETVEGGTRAGLLLAFADELARIDGRAEDLLAEMDPTALDELLPDWERALGLPDPRLGESQTIEQRRALVVAKLIADGGNTRAYFIELAATLGFTIAITEFHSPFRVGRSAVGDALENGPWLHAWQVNAPEYEVTFQARAGACRAGDPLRLYGNLGTYGGSDGAFEITIRDRAPAHTVVLFHFAN